MAAPLWRSRAAIIRSNAGLGWLDEVPAMWKIDPEVQAERQKKLLEARNRRNFIKEMVKSDMREELRKKKEAYYARQPRTLEDTLRVKIKKLLRVIEEHREDLRKLSVVEGPSLEPAHDPEHLTPEEIQYHQKMGEKYRNYASVGKRGVFGGVIENLHSNWKKHVTVRVDCHPYTMEETKGIAKKLAKLSGGIVVDILQDKTIIMYRGANYVPPAKLIPENTLSTRDAGYRFSTENALRMRLERLKELLENYKQLKGINQYEEKTASCLLKGQELQQSPLLDTGKEKQILDSLSASKNRDNDPCSDTELEDEEEAGTSGWRDPGGPPPQETEEEAKERELREIRKELHRKRRSHRTLVRQAKLRALHKKQDWINRTTGFAFPRKYLRPFSYKNLRYTRECFLTEEQLQRWKPLDNSLYPGVRIHFRA